jgi:hypothetical protein
MSSTSPATILRETRQKLRPKTASEALIEAARLIERELRDVLLRGWNDLNDQERVAVRSSTRNEKLPTEPERWSLGQVVRLLQVHDSPLRAAVAAHAPAVERLDYDQLCRIAEMRNGQVHGRTEVDLHAATTFVDAVEATLRLLGRLPPRGRTEPSFNEVTALVKEQVDAISRAEKTSNIDLLGLTLDLAWNNLYVSLREASARWTSQHPVVLTVMLLDPQWAPLGTIDPTWPSRSEGSLATLRVAAPDLARTVPNLTVAVRRYRTLPIIHGFRVNNVVMASLLSSRRGGGTFASTAPYFITHADSPDPVEAMLHDRFDEGWRAAMRESDDALAI